MTSVLPPVARPRPVKLPAVGERMLPNGLRVLAVRRPGVPVVELRLRVPFSGGTASHVARAALLAEAFFSGTQERSAVELASALQAVGAGLDASVDADRLAVSGSVLATGLPTMLELLAEVLTAPAYPAREVAGERDRLAQEIAIARSQPAVLAGEVLLRRLYGTHPYGRELPEADTVAKLTAAALRRLHAEQVGPQESVLVLVGDLRPDHAVDTVAAALGDWQRTGADGRVPPAPSFASGPVVIVDRPGAVQTNIRLGGAALRRTDPGYAALQLANIVYGGYFSSRLVANIRERRGYTYSPHSLVEHPLAGSRLVVQADVATAVTAPALLEIRYELGRIATTRVEDGELDDARQYAVGTLALSTATSAGIASTLSQLVAAGLGVDYLREHPRALAAVHAGDVLDAARSHLAPARFATVLLGDAAVIRDGVAALDDVEVG